MPARKTPLVTGEFYHIISRGTSSMPIFKNKYDYKKFLQTMLYYQNTKPPLKLSKLIALNKLERDKILKYLREEESF